VSSIRVVAIRVWRYKMDSETRIKLPAVELSISV
jgi:hypothetical protein